MQPRKLSLKTKRIYLIVQKRRVSMKNLINKVLVILTVSAIFAGSIDASEKRGSAKRRAVYVPTEEVSAAPTAREAIDEEVKAIDDMQVLDRIETKGHMDISRKYSIEKRQTDIDAFEKLTDNAKYIEAVKNFLLGTKAEGNEYKGVRTKYQKSAIAAVKAVREKAVNKQIATTKASVENAKAEKTPTALADAQNQAGILTKMYNYLPTAKQGAAVAAIGVTFAALASLGVDYSSGLNLGTTGLQYAGTAYAGVKQIPGGLVSGAKTAGGAVWNGTKWVASYPWSAITAAAGLASSGYTGLKGYFSGATTEPKP